MYLYIYIYVFVSIYVCIYIYEYPFLYGYTFLCATAPRPERLIPPAFVAFAVWNQLGKSLCFLHILSGLLREKLAEAQDKLAYVPPN